MSTVSLGEARTPLATPALDSQVPPPIADEALPELPRLFDAEWVWGAFCRQFGEPEETPERLRLQQFLHRAGKRALVGYVAERQWDRWVVEDRFAVELRAGEPPRLFRYPDDPYLPGLSTVASAMEAHRLLPKYVNLHPQRLKVEVVRYRPSRRAVLRHRAGWRRSGSGEVTLFVRVMSPDRVVPLLTAGELAEHSGFVLPRLLGSWPEGGVVWLAAIPGETVRHLIRDGTPPAPELILAGLAPLWSAPPNGGRPLEVKPAFDWAERVLSNGLPEGAGRELLSRALEALGPFADAWRPSALAHNDFYDDQLILTPTGDIALVDFEEVGPGDPMMDVGMLLAHLRWMASFGISTQACDGYRRRFRAAAIQRFGWDSQKLAQREAFALFRLCTNPIRKLRRHWPQAVETGLTLVMETLDDPA